MQLSQEFIEAQLADRRRTIERQQFVHRAAACGSRQRRAKGVLASLRRGLRRSTAWFTASQLGPSAHTGHHADGDPRL